VNTLIAYYLNSYWSGRFIGYSFKQQVVDILPSFVLALAMALSVFVLGLVLPFSPLLLFVTQILAGAAFIFLFCEITKFDDYIFLKEILIEKTKEIYKKSKNNE